MSDVEELLKDLERRLEEHPGDNWILGDICNTLRDYGLSLKEWAGGHEVGFELLSQCGRVVKTFTPEERRMYCEQEPYRNLQWCHFRHLYRREDRHEWLTRVAENSWTVSMLESKLKGKRSCSMCGKPVDESCFWTVKKSGEREQVFCSVECIVAWYSAPES